MPLHTWVDHVVHVELLSADLDIARTSGLLLERRFATQEVDVTSAPGQLQIRSEPDTHVTAAAVAQALLEAGVRAHTVHERQEWSVAEVPKS